MSKLNNNDFSQLLNQADKDVLVDLTQSRKKKSAESASSAKERHKQRYLQILKRQKQKEKVAEEREQEDGSQWRDRAEERRKGTAEYARVAEEHQMLRDRSEEESKFLGGDVEHTHLVKGLDYVLLAKVKSEIGKKESEKKKSIQETTAQYGMALPKISTQTTSTSLIAKKITNEILNQVHPHHLSFQKKLQRIDSVVLRGAHFRGNTRNFLPGRMIYQFDLNWKMGASDVPVVIFQSTDESIQRSLLNNSNSVVAPIHDKILSDLADAVDWSNQNKKGGKKRREEFFTLPKDDELYPIGESLSLDTAKHLKPDTRSQTDEDEEDIFGGVGGYDAAQKDPDKSENDIEMDDEKHNYFGEEHNNEGTSFTNCSVLPSELVTKIEAVRKGGGEEVVQAKRARAFDDYDECYPDMGAAMSWGEEGSDNDEDDQGKKKKKPKGEEDGSERKKPKFTARAAKRQAEREWKQIETIIEKKKSRGLDALETEIKKKDTKSVSKSLNVR